MEEEEILPPPSDEEEEEEFVPPPSDDEEEEEEVMGDVINNGREVLQIAIPQVKDLSDRTEIFSPILPYSTGKKCVVCYCCCF